MSRARHWAAGYENEAAAAVHGESPPNIALRWANWSVALKSKAVLAVADGSPGIRSGGSNSNAAGPDKAAPAAAINGRDGPGPAIIENPTARRVRFPAVNGDGRWSTR